MGVHEPRYLHLFMLHLLNMVQIFNTTYSSSLFITSFTWHRRPSYTMSLISGLARVCIYNPGTWKPRY